MAIALSIPSDAINFALVMKTELSSLDIYFLLKELRLAGSRIDKVYQIGDTIKLVIRGGEKGDLIIAPRYFCISSFVREAPKEPTSFAMQLRKHLGGRRILSIEQHEFDRIVKLGAGDGGGSHFLIFELFGKGNVILCDGDLRIIGLLKRQKWRDRVLAVNQKYAYPPSNKNILKSSFDDFAVAVLASKKNIASVIATDYGFGGGYAEEVCERAKVERGRNANSLSSSEVNGVFDAMRKILGGAAHPAVWLEGDKMAGFAPFELKNRDALAIKRTEFATFNEAVDYYFNRLEISESAQSSERKGGGGVEKLKKVLEEQEKAAKELEGKERGYREFADGLYARYNEVNQLMERARRADRGWMEFLRGQGFSEFDTKELAFKYGYEWLFLKKSLQDNTGYYYEKSKKCRERLRGAQRAALDTQGKIRKAESGAAEAKRTADARLRRKGERRKWYEKFRWFYSSGGFLVIGGKDATSNEVLIKKHLDARDLVFHANVHGAPFFIVKTEGREAEKNTIEEAAQAAAAYSSAWKDGFGSCDVYSVRPDQLSKTPQSGEYLGRGAFVVRGERVWYKNTELKLAVGIDKGGGVIGGPVGSVRKNGRYAVVIGVGNQKAGDLASDIKRRFLTMCEKGGAAAIKSITIDDIQRFIPAGKGALVKS